MDSALLRFPSFRFFFRTLCAAVLLCNTSAERLYSSRGNQKFEPQDSSYFSSVAIFGIVGIAIAGATVLGGALFGAINELCFRLPKRSCPNPFASSKKPEVLRILMYVAAGLIVAFTVLGFVGSDLLSAGISTLTSKVVALLNQVDEDGKHIVLALSPLDTSLDFTVYRDGLRAIASTGQNSQDYVHAVDITRAALIYVSFYTALLAVSLGLAYAILKSRKLALAFLGMGFAGAAFMWLNFSVHLPLAYYADDLCYSAKIYHSQNISKDDPSNPMIWFGGCLKQAQYSVPFNGLISTVNATMVDLNNCTTTYLSYSFSYTSPTSNDESTTVALIIASIQGISSNVTAKLPNNQVIRNKITPTLATLSILQGVAKDLQGLIICQPLLDLVDVINNDVCDVGKYVILCPHDKQLFFLKMLVFA
eukprot:TRINITY_DN1908_c0_g1_i2.p1 TRINITY_DN1908_c0_g1~~TRINITY_DN1908_c0_g1_i2.p1  ORF type:complete len:440 (+),score=-27.43 TRINITY_DN1908_c0_g1_i2:59-1321(+)